MEGFHWCPGMSPGHRHRGEQGALGRGTCGGAPASHPGELDRLGQGTQPAHGDVETAGRYEL